MDLHLEGKVIFVTGGFKGIGKGIALQLAREGAIESTSLCASRRVAASPTNSPPPSMTRYDGRASLLAAVSALT